ncbi:MAG TPA: thioredoxin domain-containing protein, partial [Longimicrobiales bacterium]|nr:thioredoxin domain-containing protein [Longimicrobiales bacterium]
LTLNRVSMDRAGDRPKCGKCQRPILMDRPLKVDPDDFQKTVLESQVPVLVDFYADWCAPCRMLAPHLDRVAAAGVGRLLVAKVDSDRAPELSQRFGIRGLPTVVLFRDGAEADRVVGMDPAGIQRLGAAGQGG